jgi:hypothetical protein
MYTFVGYSTLKKEVLSETFVERLTEVDAYRPNYMSSHNTEGRPDRFLSCRFLCYGNGLRRRYCRIVRHKGIGKCAPKLIVVN